MKLSDVCFKHTYNTYKDNVIKDFYIKALAKSTNYDRISAYFDGKILSFYARGLKSIFDNSGKIRFVFSCNLEEKEYELIKEGYNNRIYNELAEKVDKDELDAQGQCRLSNIAYLIEIGMVDIKIAFTTEGILHSKFGLIYDDENVLYFRGSNNETAAAVEKNHEMFEVSCDWHGEVVENEKIDCAKSDFNKIWNNEVSGMIVVDIPTVIRNKLMSYSEGCLKSDVDIQKIDSIVLDVNQGEFYIQNLLLADYKLKNDYHYKKSISKYIEKIDDNKYIIKKGINYGNLIKIKKHLSKISDEEGHKLFISDEFNQYIKNKNLEIEKRCELGKMIKEESDEIHVEYGDFLKIVNIEMTRNLRSKQMWNSFHIAKMIKSANFSVPGSGKTSIVYGAFAYLNSKKIDKVDKIIMIGPKNSFMSWVDEFYENFGDKKELRVLNIQDIGVKNEKREHELRFESGGKNLILINYELLTQLEDVLSEIITDRDMLVFDEIHRIKKINGKRAKSALNIAGKAKYKIALTGTPIPNSFCDIYNVLNILYTEEYSSFFGFSSDDLKKTDGRFISKINSKIYPFFCRTTKDDLNVPKPNEDEVVNISMTKDEEKLFQMLREKYSKSSLTLYIRMMQAANNPRLLLGHLDDKVMNDFLKNSEEDVDLCKMKVDREIHSTEEEKRFIEQFNMTSKFWEGIERIKKLTKEGKSVIVWGIFKDTLERINTEVSLQGIKSGLIYGDVEQNNREEIIKNFKEGNIKVLITNPHTLAESVSLHKCCHDAIYFEYSFNLTHMLQSRDRIHRLGLRDDQYTQYSYLVLEGSDIENDSIDKKTYNRLKEKEAMMLQSIEGKNIEPINFDMIDDIKRILGE